MLKRLKVKNFKNLVDLDVRFGPFTCIAGENGSGKSNLFDAIKFLGALAEKPLREAALSIRNEGGRSGDVRGLFHRDGDRYAEEMSFEAEIELPPEGVDDLGRRFKLPSTNLTYSLLIQYADHRLVNAHEMLSMGQDSVVLPLSGLDAPKAYLAIGREPHMDILRNEMRSWRCLQLEPSALRQPDDFGAEGSIGADGAHLPATLDRLSRVRDIFPRLTSRLAELIPEIRDIRVDRDEGRQLLTLQVLDKYGAWHNARALSDGTLRFLALAAIEWDPEAVGVICLEEPENGIHPARIPSVVGLLRAIAFDPEFPAGEDNPLRQVIINTHSPTVVASVPEDSLLFARSFKGRMELSCLPGTWRAGLEGADTIQLGELLTYLKQVPPSDDGDGVKRVIDRADVSQIGQPA